MGGAGGGGALGFRISIHTVWKGKRASDKREASYGKAAKHGFKEGSESICAVSADNP